MIKFITDSASDIPVEYEQELDIDIMPIPITINSTGYYERRDFTPDEFYKILDKLDKIPSTSHINILQFGEKYKEIYEAGYDEIVHVTIASAGSTMYESANMAREMFYKEDESLRSKIKIHIIDSKTYSYAYGFAVVTGARMAREGRTVAQILDYLKDYFNRVETYFSVCSLDYAKKSGRIGVATTFVGEMLGIRPIIAIIDGEMKIVDKVRGDKNIPLKLSEVMKEKIDKEYREYNVIVGSDETIADSFLDICKRLKDAKFVDRVKVGASVTINSGHKVLGITFLGKART